MIDQKVILVDCRGITRDLMMELTTQSYTRELAKIDSFFDSNVEAVFDIINHAYLTEVSQGKNSSHAIVAAKVHNLVAGSLCQHFPAMSMIDINNAQELFMRVVFTGVRARVPTSVIGGWTECVIKTLALDAYAIICTKQTVEPLSIPQGHGIFIHPINSKEFYQYT